MVIERLDYLPSDRDPLRAPRSTMSISYIYIHQFTFYIERYDVADTL